MFLKRFFQIPGARSILKSELAEWAENSGTPRGVQPGTSRTFIDVPGELKNGKWVLPNGAVANENGTIEKDL